MTIDKLRWLAALGILATSAPALAQETQRQPQAGAEQLQTSTIGPYGQVLTLANGHPVYVFMADRKNTSECYSACAQAWPPVTSTAGMMPQAGKGLDASKLTTIKRNDGTTQLAYNGHPLYTYIKDTAPNEAHGQDVRNFGGEWYLISPQGNPIRGEQKK